MAGAVWLASYGMYPEQVTLETLAALRRCDAVLLLDNDPKLASWLGEKVLRFPRPGGGSSGAALRRAARLAAALASRGKRVGVLSNGNPTFLSSLAELLADACRRRETRLIPLNAVSSFDAMSSLLGLSRLPDAGMRLVSACTARAPFLDPRAANLVFDLHAFLRQPRLREAFLAEAETAYPPGHPALLAACRSAERPRDLAQRLTVALLGRALASGRWEDATLYLPPLGKGSAPEPA